MSFGQTENGTKTIYDCISTALEFPKKITGKAIHKQVQERIRVRHQQEANDSLTKNINTNNGYNYNQVKSSCDENEVLADIIKVKLCVIFLKTTELNSSSIRVHYYGHRLLSSSECIYVIYDELKQCYYLLSLYNKVDPNGKSIAIFRSDNNEIQILIQKYFEEHYKYYNIMQLDRTDTVVAEVLSTEMQHKFVNISSDIALNAGTAISQKQLTGGHSRPPMPDMSMETLNTNKLENDKIQAIENSIWKTTHDFHRGEVENDSLCLYRSVITGADRVDTISATRLREEVADFILQSDDIKIPCVSEVAYENREEYVEKIRQGLIWSGEPVLEALAFLYPKYLFCVISKHYINETEYKADIYKYVKDMALYKKCIFLLHDAETCHYDPIYLYNKIDEEEEKNNFKYDNDVMRNLLRKFIRNEVKYDGDIRFPDSINSGESNEEKLIEENDIDISHTIINNNVTDARGNLETDKSSWKNDANQKLSLTISSTNKGNINSLSISKHVFEATHEFFRKHNSGEGHCLFLSFCQISCGLNINISVKELRKKAADHTRQSKDVADVVLWSEKKLTREQYCNQIEKTNEWGGDIEIRAISDLFQTTVFLVDATAVDRGAPNISITEFPDDKPSFQKSCYIFLRGNHYEALCLRDINNPNKEMTIFDRNDRTVKKLLDKYIREKIHQNANITFTNKNTDFWSELEADVEYLDESGRTLNPTTMDLTNDLSRKRKLSDNKEDNESSAVADTMHTSSSSIATTNKDNNELSASARSIPTHDAIPRFRENNVESMDMNNSLQTDMLDSSDTHMITQQQLESSSTVLSTTTSTAYCEQNQQQVRLETDLIPEFRGHTTGNYVPKKETKRNGTISTLRKPSYFSDRYNRHYLNLMMSEMLFAGDLHNVCLEICITTRLIVNCRYIHPYFQFYIHGDNVQPFTINPVYIYLGYDKKYGLTEHSEQLRSLQLFLSVVMLKGDDLLKNQPIQVFQLSPGGQVDTRKYDKVDTYQNAFHLNDLCFTITPWIKDPHCNKYRRRPEFQYISSISTQNKNFKVQQYLNSLRNP